MSRTLNFVVSSELPPSYLLHQHHNTEIDSVLASLLNFKYHKYTIEFNFILGTNLNEVTIMSAVRFAIKNTRVPALRNTITQFSSHLFVLLISI